MVVVRNSFFSMTSMLTCAKNIILSLSRHLRTASIIIMTSAYSVAINVLTQQVQNRDLKITSEFTTQRVGKCLKIFNAMIVATCLQAASCWTATWPECIPRSTQHVTFVQVTLLTKSFTPRDLWRNTNERSIENTTHALGVIKSFLEQTCFMHILDLITFHANGSSANCARLNLVSCAMQGITTLSCTAKICSPRQTESS